MRIRLPWTRRRRRPDEAAGARVVDLSIWNGDGADCLTPIARPDSLHPLDHTLPGIDPEVIDARAAVAEIVADLARRGCLDAGTNDVLDYWIDGQLAEWQELVRVQAEDRRRVAAQLVAVDVENLVREAAAVEDERAALACYEATHAHWRDLVLGRPDGHAPATSPTVRAA